MTFQSGKKVKGDMMKVYNITNSVDKENRKTFFVRSQDTRTRGHLLELVGDRIKIDKRKYFIMQYVGNLWT